MSDRVTETEPHDRSALWHFREASKYASWASYTTQRPGTETLASTGLVNPEVQAHYREMAVIHATLFAGLATALSGSPHSAARANLSAIAAMPDGEGYV